MRQVQAGSKADFQYDAGSGRKQFAPMPPHERAIQQEIAQAWEDNTRIEVRYSVRHFVITTHSAAESSFPYS
jgi:hypothetical protein